MTRAVYEDRLRVVWSDRESNEMRRARLLLPCLLLTIFAATATAADRDRDGVEDTFDNCLWEPNPDQRDSDRDGFGNRCDADLSGDGRVSTLDFPLFAAAFGGTSADADFDGDGRVTSVDFAIFAEHLGKAAGPGAVQAYADPLFCNGGFCTIQVAPGVELDVDLGNGRFVEQANGDLVVTGDVQIYTVEGGITLGDVDLVVTPGVGMVGTSRMPDYSIGALEGSPRSVVPARLDVVTAQGRDLDLEIPLYDDVYYVVFSLDRTVVDASFWEFALGEFQWSVDAGSFRLVIDPVDPFLYVGSDVLIPIVTARNLTGVDLIEFGQGYGVSIGGRIPFAPAVPVAIAEVLPEIQGDTISYASADVTSMVPLFSTVVSGVMITDEDPDENGRLVPGSTRSAERDYRRVLDGTIEQSLSISILPTLSFPIAADSPLGKPRITLISQRTGVGTPREKKESWLSLDIEDLGPVDATAHDWITLPASRTSSVFYVSDDPDENYFRFATDEYTAIDSRRMAAVHGVDANVLSVRNTYAQLDRRQLTFESTSFAESIHADVDFTAKSRTRLVLPTSNEAAFDLTIETESRIGGVSLDQYGMQLTIDAYTHWGRFVTPHYAYGLRGSFSDAGAWLEGEATAPLPYRYPAVDLAADVAGRIAEQEAAVAFAQADYDVNLEILVDYQRRLSEASADLATARGTLASAQEWLSQKRRSLRDHQSYDCGTCKWYDAPCWTRVGACQAWKVAATPALEALVDTATAGVSVAQASVNRAQRAFDEISVLVAGAESAVEIALAARDEAQAALVLLRAERASLPQEDGVVDATVRLRLTRDGLTGTVSGRFAGADFGEGRIVDDAAGPRACFVVPQTGEELCADL